MELDDLWFSTLSECEPMTDDGFIDDASHYP